MFEGAADLLQLLAMVVVQGIDRFKQVPAAFVPPQKFRDVAGCRVIEGRMIRSGDVRVMRDGQNVEDGVINSLRHFREEVNEMNAGTECGVIIQGFNDFKEGDLLEVHRQERGRR